MDNTTDLKKEKKVMVSKIVFDSMISTLRAVSECNKCIDCKIAASNMILYVTKYGESAVKIVDN